MPGATAQLSNYGTQDVYLTDAPQVTYFRAVIKRHTNFSLEAVSQTFDGSADFGRKTSVTLSKNGDLVGHMWLQVTLPDLASYDIQPAPAEGQTVNVTEVAGVTSSSATADLVGTLATRVWKNSQSAIFAYERNGLVYSNAALTTEFDTWPYLLQNGNQFSAPSAKVRWCNAIGYALLSSVEVVIGGTRIDRHVPEFWDAYEELSEPEHRRQGLWEMIGKYADSEYDSTFRREQSKSRTLYIPMQFYFNRNINMALPIVALTYHTVQFNFEFRPYLECVRSTVPVTTLTSKYGGAMPEFLDAKLYCEYVFLDTQERQRFIVTPHEYLIQQVQFLGDEVVQPASINRKFQLNFSHPVKEIIWVYVPKTYYDPNPQTGNQIFKYDIPGDSQLDIFESARIIINGNDRFSEQTPGYFRILTPFYRHTRTPSKKVYVYSFAVKPEDIQPSGHCNFSRVESSQLAIKFNPQVQMGRLKVFAVSYNVFKIEKGMSGLTFAS